MALSTRFDRAQGRRAAAATPPDGGPVPGRGRRSPWWAFVLVLAAEAVVLLAPSAPEAWSPLLGALLVPVGAGSLLVVPVWLVARKAPWRTGRLAEDLLYATVLVVLGLMLLALAVNTVLPWLAVEAPLRRDVLVAVSTVANLALLSVRSHAVPVTRATVLDLPGAVALCGVVLAVVGAVRLNNDAGGTVAAVAVATGLVALGLLLARREEVGADLRVTDSSTVYLVGLALLLATSLRGWGLLGHDSQRELVAFRATEAASRWSMESFSDAYNACLSVSLLPFVVSVFTGLGGVVIFKVVFPVLFALVPVQVYAVARRMVSRRLALLSVVLLMGFPTFFADMPWLARQQVAFVFFGAMLLAATQPGWAVRTRRVAVVVFGLGVVLSHYSTTYVLLLVLVLGFVASRVLALRARGESPAPVLLAWPVIVSLVLAAGLWSGPVTGAGGDLVGAIKDSVRQAAEGGDATNSSDRAYSLLFGDPFTDQERLDEFARESTAPGVGFDDAIALSASERRPRVEEVEDLPLTAAGARIDAFVLGPLGVEVSQLQRALRLVAVVLLQVGFAVGLVVALRRRGPARDVPPELSFVAVGFFGALVIQVLAPGLTAEYGVLRTFQQALMVGAPVIVLGMVSMARIFGRRAAPVVVAAVVLGVFASLTGLLPMAFGGYPPQLHLSNQGQYAELYLQYDEEVDAVRWLTGTALPDSPGTQVSGDAFLWHRLTHSMPREQHITDRFFPTLVRERQWVLLGAPTVRDGVAYHYAEGKLVRYAYPVQALQRTKDRLYDNGLAEVLR